MRYSPTSSSPWWRRARTLTLVTAALALGACATAPTGPSMLVLPGSGKSVDTFRFDDFECRNFATAQAATPAAEQARQDSLVRGAALGTVVGAIAGAAIDGSRGAGVGAGTGLIIGTASGASSGAGDSYSAQRRYDHAYIQCMYSKGHRVPVDGRLSEQTGQRAAPATARPAVPAPPA
ncbi:MAG: glycine zipper family protein, partial [Betaproteobacteria bacterium]